MKVSILIVLALALGACTGRSLTAQQLAGIGQVDVIVGAVPSIPLVRVPPPPDPPKRPPIDTSKGVGTAVSQMVAGAAADVSAATASEQRNQTIAARLSTFVRAMGTYDFGPDMFAATKDALDKVRAVRLEVRPPPLGSRAEALRRSIFEQSHADAVLFFSVEYSFVELYGVDYAVAFNATAEMFPRRPDLKNLRPRPDDANPLVDGNAIYRRHFEETIKYRSGDDVPTMFRQAAQSLASKLARDLDRPK